MNNLPPEFLQKQCASVRSRSNAVLKAKGDHSKYLFELKLSSVYSMHFVNCTCHKVTFQKLGML